MSFILLMCTVIMTITLYSTVCPYGYFGRQCLGECYCPNDCTCDPVTGSCQYSLNKTSLLTGELWFNIYDILWSFNVFLVKNLLVYVIIQQFVCCARLYWRIICIYDDMQFNGRWCKRSASSWTYLSFGDSQSGSPYFRWWQLLSKIKSRQIVPQSL